MATYKRLDTPIKSTLAFSSYSENYIKDKHIIIALDTFSEASFHIIISEEGNFLSNFSFKDKKEAYRQFCKLQEEFIGEIVTIP